ncbi:cytochrome b-c1 complex subunit 8 [Trichogramma pretiosum]|uniref:cytochrome b-c1 complex subunit 8 n=1 Tax=Trichogramma pretiosum TaxID=7493 RepID=UPI0006C9A3E6|nr:cytochrome b-c1 complex subunit 8 [Trichogramma pretiosum]XP_014223876.1 cytochrome b-c1 complex subunit 8 [Trichogramma pretiosum]XP_014223877.1 cytochrome b-c1 complex subunit 8 [Trichogramma pretiosum]
MHSDFGNLAKLRRIVYYRLSPHEMNPLHGIISHGVPNMIRRFRESVFLIAPWAIGTYLLVDWAEAKNEEVSRKNPKDYENDK